jgi:hypothetical protein
MPIDHIETQRLRIRSFQPNDWQAVYDYTSDPAVMMYIPEGPFTPEQAKAFVADNMGEQARFVAVLLKPDDMLVGHMEFHPWFVSQIYEIGWVFNRAYHGQGMPRKPPWHCSNMALKRGTCIASSLPVNPRMLLRVGLWKSWACDERPTFESVSGVRIMGGGTNTYMLFWKKSGSRPIRHKLVGGCDHVVRDGIRVDDNDGGDDD